MRHDVPVPKKPPDPSLARVKDAARLMDLLAALGRRGSLRDPIASAVEASGLTTPQIHAILWLGRDQPLTMGELAQRVGVTEKTITGIVDRLEREGYAQRLRDTADRRVIKVALADKGQNTAQVLSGAILEKTATFLSAIEDDDREALFRILERLLSRPVDH